MVRRQYAWSLLIASLFAPTAVCFGQSELRIVADPATPSATQESDVVPADFEEADAAATVLPCGGAAYGIQQKGCAGGGCGAGGYGQHGYGYGYGYCHGMPLVDRHGHYYPHGWYPHGWMPYGYGPGYPVPANAGRMYEGYNADLFYNYYAPQGSAEGVATDMYPSPHYTPWPAIQVYYTYQPWMPHEFLYNHHRSYTRYYSGGMGRNTTHVSWGGSPTRRVFEQGFVK